MPNHNKSSQHANADVFTAIAHPVRRQILDCLRKEDATVSSLASQFEVSRPAVSQHLAILLDVGLVTSEKQGRHNHYHLEPDKLEEIDAWVRHYRRFWGNKLDALDDFLKQKASDDEA
ncbi:MAG: metalloregulator ArsR/SmtB family transcription factor [Phototrophicaceae bacterium]